MPPIELRPEGEPYKPTSPVATPSSSPPNPPVPDITIDTPGNGATHLNAPRRSSTSSSRSSISASPAASDPLSVTTLDSSQLSNPVTPPDPRGSSPPLPDPQEVEQALSDSVLTVTSRETPLVPEPKPKPVSQKRSTSGADLILPIIIYAVVKANPPQLASQLMYLRRYRSAICLTGEASYAIVNLTAVVEFLEHVELSELGLGKESDKVIRWAVLFDDISWVLMSCPQCG
jgi:hypothetical protein